MAILKDGSPSCGSGLIYDGSFRGTRIAGTGVTAVLLTRHGIRVFSETQLDQAEAYLTGLEADARRAKAVIWTQDKDLEQLEGVR